MEKWGIHQIKCIFSGLKLGEGVEKALGWSDGQF